MFISKIFQIKNGITFWSLKYYLQLNICSYCLLLNIVENLYMLKSNNKLSSLKILTVTSLVQWLGLCTFTAEGPGSVTGKELRSHRSCLMTKKENRKKNKTDIEIEKRKYNFFLIFFF